MKTIKGSINANFTKIIEAMKDSESILLPKTVASSKEKPLVVLEANKASRDGCR